MTETPKPTPQSGEPVIFKKENGNYRVSQITGEITEPLLIQDDIADLEAAKRVAKEVLTGGQTWYHDYRDPPFRLRNSHEICSATYVQSRAMAIAKIISYSSGRG